MVLMLEPLHACNLTCTGCGRIREYESTIKQKLSIEECLDSVDECGAPVVSICGGEPMIYPGIGELVGQDPGAEEGRLPLHQRHVHPQEARRVQALATLLLQRPPRRDEGRPTTSPSSARGSSTRPSTASRRPRRPASWSAPTPRSSRKPTWPSSTAVRLPDDARRRRLHDLARLQLRGGGYQGDLHDPRRHPGQVPRGRGDVPQVQVQHLAGLPGVPPGQARDAAAPPGPTRPGTSRAGRARAT